MIGLWFFHPHAWGEDCRDLELEQCDGFLWVKVSSVGHEKALNFVVDTGAASSVVDLETAKTLNLKLSGQILVHGIHSKSIAQRIKGFAAFAGKTPLPCSPLAIDLSAVSSTCSRKIDGLVGADFFRDRIVQLDALNERLRILTTVAKEAKGIVLPMRQRNGTFQVPVGVAGNNPQWMRVDTGCSSPLEWVTSESKKIRLSGTTIGFSKLKSRSLLTSIRLGKADVNRVRIGVHDQQMFPGEFGLLGNPILSSFCVTFDIRGGRLILEQ